MKIFSGLQVQPGAETPVRIKGAVIDLSTARSISSGYVSLLNLPTSRPGSVNYSRTVSSGDIPSGWSENVLSWQAVLAVGGKNSDAANARNTITRFTLNGTDIGPSDTTIAVTAARYWMAVARYSVNPIVENDVLGVRLWASATGPRLEYASLYIIPREYAPGSTKHCHTMVIPGTTFTVANTSGIANGSIGIGTGLIYDLGIGLSVGSTGTALQGQTYQLAGAHNDSVISNSGTYTVESLPAFALPRYMRRNDFYL